MLDMKTLRFKTTINCSGCVAKVKPFLDKEVAIRQWSVDTDSFDKILSVETSLSLEQLCAYLNPLGFEIIPLI